MRPSPPDNSPEARQRADARLRRLTRSAAVLATGATFAIGVVVAKEHPGASAPSTPGPVEAPGTSVPTTSTLGQLDDHHGAPSVDVSDVIDRWLFARDVRSDHDPASPHHDHLAAHHDDHTSGGHLGRHVAMSATAELRPRRCCGVSAARGDEGSHVVAVDRGRPRPKRS